MTSYTPVRLAYVISEPASGANENLPPVLFLHGTTATKECWGTIPQAVADQTKRRVYSLDCRNHGDSEWTNIFNFDVNSDDLLHFMDSEGIPKAVLIGHSMGGVTCMQTAFKWPDRVEMAFVVDMFVKRIPQKFLDAVISLIRLFEDAVQQLPTDIDESEAQRRILRYARASTAFTDAIFTLLTRPLTQRIRSSAPKCINSQKSETANNKRKGNANLPLKRNAEGKYSLKFNSEIIAEAMKYEESNMSEADGVYEGPVYFIYGSDSPYNVIEDLCRIRKHFSNATLVEIEGSGHNIHVDMPEQLTQEILNYM